MTYICAGVAGVYQWPTQVEIVLKVHTFDTRAQAGLTVVVVLAGCPCDTLDVSLARGTGVDERLAKMSGVLVEVSLTLTR